MFRFTIFLIAYLFAGSLSAKDITNPASKSSAGSAESPFSDEVMSYVEANVLATFFHEVGHALIDKLNLPIYAREEDAADYFAVILTEYLLPEDQAELVTWASADQFLQANHRFGRADPYYAGVHSLDLVRYYNTICIYYGGDVDLRDDFAIENGLPASRMETCEEERWMAERAWGEVIESIVREEPGFDWLVIDEYAESNNKYVLESHRVVEDAVKMLNEQFALRSKVRVRLTECGEDNAFYDPSGLKILMCNELVPPLSRRIEEIVAPNANR